jgi:hypothetical protein
VPGSVGSPDLMRCSLGTGRRSASINHLYLWDLFERHPGPAVEEGLEDPAASVIRVLTRRLHTSIASLRR